MRNIIATDYQWGVDLVKKNILISIVCVLVLAICFMIFWGAKSGNYTPDDEEQQGGVSQGLPANTDMADENSDSEQIYSQIIGVDFKEIEIGVEQMGKSFAISNDGKRIAYAGYNGENGMAEIWVSDIDADMKTGNSRMIESCSTNLGNTGYFNIAWLPDNSGFIYFSDEDYKVQIKKYTVKSGKFTILRSVKPGIGISSISFGKVSQKLYYTEDIPDELIESVFKTNNISFNNENQIGKIATDTGDQMRQIIPMMNVSPDEQKLVFSSYNRFTNKYSVWIYDIKTQKMDMISDMQSHAVTPIWSPDGKYVAYSERSGNAEYYIAIYNTQNGNTNKIYAEGIDITHPYWHPDGKLIIYIYCEDNIMGLRCRSFTGMQ